VVDAGVAAGGGVTHEIFLLDTLTGRVWRSQAAGILAPGNSVDGEVIQSTKIMPEEFVPLTVLIWSGSAARFVPRTEVARSLPPLYCVAFVIQSLLPICPEIVQDLLLPIL
jgi:hypothetical protein